MLEPVRNGIYKPKEFHGSGVPIVNMGELFAYPRLKSVEMNRVQLTENEKEKSLLRNNDLIFARRSLTAEGAGKCSLVYDLKEETTFESSIIRARPDPSLANSEFLFYYFNSAQGKHLLGTILRQVAVSGITGSDLMELLVRVPPLEDQKAIATILSSLDDKIELNRRMNATLEAMARALFKAWFVDFEPVHANLENRPSTSASPEIAKLFPSTFENGIPTGWKTRRLGEVSEVKGGTTPSTKTPEFWNGENFWATPKDLSDLRSPVLLTTERKITDAGVKQISSGVLPAGTLLLSSRAPIGYLAISQVPVSINQGFIALQGVDVSNLFLLHWLAENMEVVKSRANGSTFQEISKSNFRQIQIDIPHSDIYRAFEKFAISIHAKICANERESENLKKIRNLLLARLISGVLTV